jgi:hypothetical protein
VRLLWQCPGKTEYYRPDFSSERAPHIKIIKERRRKIGLWSQMVA